MALPVLTYTDFVADLRLSVGQTEQEDILNEYISTFYEKLMIEMLGNQAKLTIEAFDWETPPTGTPPTQKWLDLVNGIDYFNIKNDRSEKSYGFNQIALPVLYYLYNKDFHILSNTGFVRNDNENSMNASSALVNSFVSARYNKGIRLYNESLIPFLDNYDNFQGEITSIVDNAGTLTINTPNTIYLEDGDTVTINSIDYTISNLVENTSYEITSTLIDATDYFYSPYEDVIYHYKNTIF